VFFHLLDQFGGLVIADPQFSLDIACRYSAVARHDGDGLFIKALPPRQRAVEVTAAMPRVRPWA